MSTSETDRTSAPAFRVDVNLHELLKDSSAQRDPEESDLAEGEGLPEPIYPQRPEVMWKTDREFHNFKAWRAWKGLGAPYFKSRLMPGELRL